MDAGSALKLAADGRTEQFLTIIDIEAYPESYADEVSPVHLPVLFTWNAFDFANGESVRLEISRDRRFSAINQSLDASSGNSALLTMDSAGTYYWRIYPAGSAAENASEGKFDLVYSQAPLLVSPMQDSSYSYRTIKPAVRMYWSSQNDDAWYQVEIADNPQLNNSEVMLVQETSMVMNDFDAGSWYWRVTPIYPNGFLVNNAPSNIGHFTIEQGGELTTPELLIPVPDAAVVIGEEDSNEYFSWKRDPEAVSYTIQISDSANLENPVISHEAADNFYTYAISQNILQEGRYYWAVYQTDSEGNTSPLSERRPFSAVQEKPAFIPPVEPEPVPAVIETPPVPIELPPIAPLAPFPPFAGPRVVSPLNNQVFGIDELAAMNSFNFAWQPVEGANHYVFSLFTQSESGELTQITANQSLTRTSYAYEDLSGLLDSGTTFVWRLEAQSLSSDGNVARRGDGAEYSFTVDLPEVTIIRTRDPGVMYGN
jgi:hypothetical protein